MDAVMNPDEFLQAIAGCKNYLLAEASRHEQAACYARYCHDVNREDAQKAEQKALLHWAAALAMVLEGR